MHKFSLRTAILLFSTIASSSASAQLAPRTNAASVAIPVKPQALEANPTPAQITQHLSEIIQRVVQREAAEQEIISSYTPVVETYIQVEKSNALLGTVPRKDFYFLGLADFRGKNLGVHSMLKRTRKGTLLWAFDPDGFLQMVFPDWGQFDVQHYRFNYAGRDFLGEVRCFLFDVQRAPKVRGPRFVGRIWVEDQDYTIVRMNGAYAPEIHFSLKQLADDFYVHFDSWRTNVKPGVWLPSEIFSQELREPVPTGGPRFKARTHLWGYGLATRQREEELGRMLIESPTPIKDDSGQQDRSPLEQQRRWRLLAESNVLDVLERAGLVAPQGDVENVLNKILTNLLVTNHLDALADLHCRVLMTTDLEMFSLQSTIVLSRGLIDVVPNEETLATLLASEIADAMTPKPAQDQYGFSDILRLTPTEVVRQLSFADKPAETARNSERALEFLRNSPYASELANAGLFLSELQSQAKSLKELISPRLGNQVHFTAELLRLAPTLQPEDLQQLAALPIGSRLKVNPWTDAVSFLKTRQMTPVSPRDKMPFEVTPFMPYLIRAGTASAASDVQPSLVPRSQMP